MGIQLKQMWRATLDGKTRHAHRQLDGQMVDIGEKFKVDGYELEYPGDPSAPGYLVYNCRCTVVSVDKFHDPNAPRAAKLGDMSYEDWKAGKEVKPTNIWGITQANIGSPVDNKLSSGIIEKKYIKFESGNSANDFFYYDDEKRGLMARKSSEHGKWMKELSDDERVSISDYTGGGYYDLNNYLRKTGDWQSINSEKEEFLAKNIDSAISRYMLKDNIRVQRGAMENVLDELISQYGDDSAGLIGKIYKDSGYMSTTALYGNPVATTKPVVFEIDIPAGVGRGAYVNQLAGQYQDAEYEFLLPRGSSFKITAIEENKEPITPQTIIKMRMIVDD